MPDSVVIDKRLPRIPTQQRSRERFEYILDCAEQMLGKGRAEEISIYEVAEKANLPAQSVYRLFPSATAINYALAQRYLTMIAELNEAADYSNCTSWQQGVEQTCSLTCAFYNSHPHAMELLLGSGVSRDIRTADRANITRLAKSTLQGLERWGLAEELPIRQVEVVIDIADAIWSQSYHYHGEITPFYITESIRATTGYLELYLPRYRPES